MRAARFATASAAALTVAFAAAPVAAATDAVYDAPFRGYDGVYNGDPAGSYRFTIEGTEVLAYCADESIALDGTASFTVMKAADSGITDIAAAGYIAANSASIGTPLTDENWEAAAVQLAVWSYTNGAVLDASSVPDSAALARALELAAAPLPPDLAASTEPVSFELALIATTAPGAVTFDALLTDGDGNPIPNAAVAFVAADATETVVTTDANGAATLTVPAAAGQAVTMTARYTGVIPAGAVLMPGNESQPLVTTDAVDVLRTAEASGTGGVTAPVETAPVATAPVETAPAPVAAPTESTEAVLDDQLADTGADGNAGIRLAVAAVLAAAAVAGLVFAARRRAG